MVHVALVLLALWPAAQMALVASYDLNAWKLGAWGMYSTPQFVPEIYVDVLTPDEAGRYPFRDPKGEFSAERDRFIQRRYGLGRLATPEALGRGILEAYPAFLGVEITVAERFINLDTGIIDDRYTTYIYSRSD